MGLRRNALVPFFVKVEMTDYGKVFLTKLDELNVIVLESWYAANRKKDILDDLFSTLVEAYLLGMNHASEQVDRLIPVDHDRMEDVIYLKIDGMTVMDRAERHIEEGDVAALQTLVESEYHRVYNTAEADGVQEFTRETGKAVSKTWHTMLDERVRDTHIDLEGNTVPANELFYANDGDMTLYPGGFDNPENNVNCRCWLTWRVNS